MSFKLDFNDDSVWNITLEEYAHVLLSYNPTDEELRESEESWRSVIGVLTYPDDVSEETHAKFEFNLGRLIRMGLEVVEDHVEES